MVSEPTLEVYRATFCEIDMFVHPAIFNVAFAATPNAQESKRIPSAVANKLILKDSLAIEV